MDGLKRMGWSSNTLNAWCIHWKNSDERINCIEIDRSESMGWLS
jgi:hypothetical protein